MRSHFECGKIHPSNISGQKSFCALMAGVKLAELGRIISFCGKGLCDPESLQQQRMGMQGSVLCFTIDKGTWVLECVGMSFQGYQPLVLLEPNLHFLRESRRLSANIISL